MSLRNFTSLFEKKKEEFLPKEKSGNFLKFQKIILIFKNGKSGKNRAINF
jgi:hypothetical protein